MLIRQYQRETGEDWVEPTTQEVVNSWEYRWVGDEDTGIQGPYDGETMEGWKRAGYFGDRTMYRRAGTEDPWSPNVDFV